jgi:predicted nucleic acid-binding protein
MRFLDTNVILRYLTGDDPVKAAACFDLFQRLQRGTETVTTCEAIITEVVYVLSSRAHYDLSRVDIRARLTPLLRVRGLRIPNKQLYLRALDVYANHPGLDFEDALAVAYMERDGVAELYSYDRGFDRVPGVQRLEPSP